MPISVECRGCGRKFQTPERLAGKRAKCPKCSAVIEVGAGLPCFGELVMAGPFLAGIGGFLFGAPCGAVACLSRSTTGTLRGILTITVAMTVATLGASIYYWLLVAPRATVPESTVRATKRWLSLA